MYDDITFPPVWGISTPATYSGPGDPLQEGVAAVLEPQQITELRVLERPDQHGRGRWLSGIFDDPHALCAAASRCDWAGARAVCVTLNTLRANTRHRVTNRLTPARQGGCVADRDIGRIRIIPVDFDPHRPSGTNASEGEHHAALDAARQACRWVHQHGAYASLADSGNGAHLYIHVDLAAGRWTRNLVDRVILAVSWTFDNGAVSVDRSTGNPAQVMRLPGTLNCKGETTAERPYRRSEMLAVRLPGQVTSRAALVAIAAEAPAFLAREAR